MQCICAALLPCAWTVALYTAVSTKVVQKSVKGYETMPKGSLGNTQYISIKTQNPYCPPGKSLLYGRGINGWFFSYLDDRTQTTHVGSNISNK